MTISGSDQGMLVYKTNREVYKTAESVDLLFSTATTVSFYKAFSNIYALGSSIANYTTFPFSPLLWTTFWSMTSWIGVKYLMTTYLSQVFMIDEIHLLENQKQVRVKTSINSWSNLFALFRLKMT